MHEFAIAESLVRAVQEELAKLGPQSQRLLRARVVCGALQGIVPECLQTAYEVMVKDTPLQGSALDVVLAPVVCECRSCGWKGEMKERFSICPTCDSVNMAVRGGKDMYLDNLEVEDESDNG